MTSLRWLTLDALMYNAERQLYPCHGVVIPLHRIEILNCELCADIGCDLLLISGGTLEKFIAQKTHWVSTNRHRAAGNDIPSSHFSNLSQLTIDDGTGSSRILKLLMGYTLSSLRYLSLRDTQFVNETFLLKLLQKCPCLAHLNFEGIRCSDELLRFIGNTFKLKHLALEGSITEDGLLSLGDELISNLESVCLASCPFQEEAKIIQFIQNTRNLHTLKINFGRTEKPSRAFFQAVLNHCSKTLRIFLCGGKGDPDLISNGSIIEELIVESKHLSIFVVDFCPHGLDRVQLEKKCRSRSDRSAVPKIILSRMSASTRTPPGNQNSGLMSTCLLL